MIIGVTGTLGSGKDTLSRYLEVRRGFVNFSTSDELRIEADKRGLTQERPTWHMIATELRRDQGSFILAKRAYERALESKEKNVVISAIRSVGEIEYLKNIDKNFLMLATDAPIELRYQRLVGRNRSGDEITFEEFKRQEDEELKPTEEFAPNLAAPIKLAHFVIINDSDLKSFENKIESILSKYGV